jgi:hypothetical protein
MAVNSNTLMSVLMRSNAMSDAQTLIDAMMSIQTQLSEIQENQRKIMKTLRDLRIEERSRLSDIKKTTQELLKETHSALSDQLNEIQDTMDDQLTDETSDLTLPSDIEIFTK